MFAAVTTPPGRIRGDVSFTAARNTPFQGLAAEGAEWAMWECLKPVGVRLVAAGRNRRTGTVKPTVSRDHVVTKQSFVLVEN
jgi:hypothetical protein